MDIPDIVRGHEIWIEHDAQKMTVRETFECRLLYGHNLAVDGIADAGHVKAAVFDPLNMSYRLEAVSGDGGLVFRFKPTMQGDHIAVAEYDAGVYTVTDNGWFKGLKKDFNDVKKSGHYYQYAKAIIPGNGNRKTNHIIGHDLEIIPGDVGDYQAGDTLAIKVVYDGAPLPDGLITAVNNGGGDGLEVVTGNDGTASVTLDRAGKWMLKIRHADPDKGVEDEYDEKVFTAVLTIMDVR